VSYDPKDSLILQAAIEFGPDYTYTIEMSTMGPALYVHADSKESAGKIRKLVHSPWNGLYTIVLYSTSDSHLEDSLFIHYKPGVPEGKA
jgi:hypothetical protein